MATLSVVLATYNEERNLKNCLETVKNLCNEIVIVDGGSKDKTIEIAKQFNSIVFITDNPPIFHINKQKAINKATCDWVLQLDADEQVTKELSKEIKEKINDSGNDVDGYWIPRKNFFLGRFLMKGGQYPDYTLRLYRKGKGNLPQKTVHEQAIVDGKVDYLAYPLIHMADASFARYLVRFNRYTDLIADEINKKKGIKFFMFFNYLIFYPAWWFLKTYFRHKGFMDSWQGFVFSFFSSLRFPIAYIKSFKK